MPENKSQINRLLNRQKYAIFTSESGPALYKMIKGDEEFYFDSTDWSEHQQEFDEMGENGWILVEKIGILPAYLISRLRALVEFGLVSLGWGYRRE